MILSFLVVIYHVKRRQPTIPFNKYRIGGTLVFKNPALFSLKGFRCQVSGLGHASIADGL
jgi:hypothetical protein